MARRSQSRSRVAIAGGFQHRAHRIGQTRPVTVYKLVLAGSVEEQILALHGSKRALVDSMLAEQDGGNRLGLDDLLALLRGVDE